MATVSLITIWEEVLKSIHRVEKGTATSGSVLTVVAAGFPFKNTSSNASASTYQDCIIYVLDATDGTTYNERHIVTYAPGTGIFTSGNSFGFLPATGDTFWIIKDGIRYDDVKDAINKALTKLSYRDTIFLTLLPDGDMEASGVTNWTGADSTTSKVTSVSINPDWSAGTQCLKIANSGVDGYAYSATIQVQEQEVYFVSANIYSDSGTPFLQAYDNTNSASIDSEDSDESWTPGGWHNVNFTFTVPSDCTAITIRVGNDTSSANTYVDNVILHHTNAQLFQLPAYIVDEEQIRRVYQVRPDMWVDRPQMYDVQTVRFIYDNGVPLLHISPGAHWPICVEIERPYAELSTNAGTTTCDKNLIVLAATSQLLYKLINRAPGQEVAAWKNELASVNRRLSVLLYNRQQDRLRHQLNG